MFDLIVKHATLVSPLGRLRADLAVRDGLPLSSPSGKPLRPNSTRLAPTNGTFGWS